MAYGQMTGGAFLSAKISVAADTAKAIREIDDLGTRHTNVMKKIAKVTKIADTALMTLAAATVAVGAGAMMAMGATMEFNTQMTTLRALSGITKDRMYELSESVNSVASEFGVAGNEIAAGTVTLAKAGLTVDEISESIRAMTQLSRANGIAFDEAATMSVFAVETFGKEFSELDVMLDKMQVAAQESILDIGDLQKGFAYAGSTANMLGVSFEELISVMAVLSNRALAAGISSRSFNKMLIDMFQHTEGVNALIQDLGYNFEIIGEDGTLHLSELINALGDTELTTQLLSVGLDIFSVRALRAFGVLAGAADDYSVMLNKVENASGALEEVTAIQMESWTAQFGRLKEEFSAVLRQPELMEQITVMVDEIVKAMKALEPDLIVYLVSSVREFTELLTGGALLDIIKSFADVMGRLASTFGAVAGHLLAFNGILMKAFIIWKVGAMVLNMFSESLVYSSKAMHKMGIAMRRLTRGGQAWANKKTSFWHKARLTVTKNAIVELANAIGFLISNVMAMYGAAILWNSSNSILIKGLSVMVAVLSAVNLGLMTYNILKEAGMSSWAPGVGIAVALAATAFYAGLVKQIGSGFNETYSTAGKMYNAPAGDVKSGAVVKYADTGMFVGTNTYDTGAGPAPRHKLVYVEPGEQIISKTQGMSGMGGGVNVYVGDVYAQDGTDFATKLADALPIALRRVSYGGSF